MIGLRPAPLRPLGVAEILDASVRLVWRNARAALSIAVPFAIARAALAAWVTYASLNSQDAATTAAIGTLLLGIAFGTFVTGLLAPLFSSDLLGAQISARDSLRRVGPRVWPLLGLGLLLTVAEGAGLAACVIGGVWMWGAWAVAAPALVLERTGIGAALSRSLALVRSSFWRVWGIRALGWLLTTILSALITFPFQALASYVANTSPLDQNPSVTHPGAYVVILAIGGILSGAVLQPISAAIDLLLYTDLRMRKEGMDIVLGIPPAVAAGPAAAPAW